MRIARRSVLATCDNRPAHRIPRAESPVLIKRPEDAVFPEQWRPEAACSRANIALPPAHELTVRKGRDLS